VQALHIISGESGIASAKLTDDSVFSDIGVDSLLSLMIVCRFHNELEIDIRTDGSMCTHHPNVRV